MEPLKIKIAFDANYDDVLKAVISIIMKGNNVNKTSIIRELKYKLIKYGNSNSPCIEFSQDTLKKAKKHMEEIYGK